MPEALTGYASPMSANQVKDRPKAKLPEELFTGGVTSGWWQKEIQKDLGAKDILTHLATRMLTSTLF